MADASASHQQTGLYSLADLGITVTRDAQGSEQLSIRLEADNATHSPASILVFDPSTQTWALETRNTTFKTNHVDEQLNRSDAAEIPWYVNLPDTEHNRFFRSVDWSATPLGPLATWSSTLQTFVTYLMSDNMAAAIYWGPRLCALYNPGMIRLVSVRLQKARATIMGGLFPEIWAEIWDKMAPILKQIKETGQAVDSIELDLYPVVDGRIEETFWTAAIMAIKAPDGTFLGYYNRGREITKEVLTERRTKTLTNIAASSAFEGEFVWNHLFDAFRANERDFPMAFAYKATENSDTGRCKLELKQSIGLPEDGHALVPPMCDLYEAHDGFIPLYRRAKSLDRPLILHQSNNTLNENLLQRFRWRGFEEPSRSIAIIAIRSSDRILGFLVIGLNPRRPCDADYEGFLNSLSRHASATVINAVDREEAKLRAERLTKQLEQNEAQIRDLAVYGPVGMLRLAPNGKILWANDQFYEITGHGRTDEDQYELSFVDVVDPEDQHLSAAKWPTLIEEHQPVDVALRLKRKWHPPSSSLEEAQVPEPMWINAIAHPIIEEGEVKGVAAAVTDISHFKWAEATQRRHAAAAKEAKRQQENFIDIVSHEMRNPLSAITQLADEISSCLDGTSHLESAMALDLLRSNISSAQTILLCAAHQKRIVDDVLTLSKLEATMLSITPVIVQPAKVVETVIKMFDGEITTNKIQLNQILDDSYTECKIEWAYIDPSRLTQILINLVSNAIKFTKSENHRIIEVRTGATLTRPTSLAGVSWLPSENKHRDPTNSVDWSHGEAIYLCFEIKDSGSGLKKEEMKMLFNKFQQATAKTHIKYGGSGLGLFISRELTETQGGEIGVDSQPGKGSTFAFYIKGRRAEAPDEASKVTPPPMPTHILEPAETDPDLMQQSSSTLTIPYASDSIVTSTTTDLLGDVQDSISSRSSIINTNTDTSSNTNNINKHSSSKQRSNTTSNKVTNEDERKRMPTTITSETEISKQTTVLLVEDNVVNAQVLTRQLTKCGVTVYPANHGGEALEFLARTRSWMSPKHTQTHTHTYLDPNSIANGNTDTNSKTEINPNQNPTSMETKIDLDFILMDVEMPIMDGLTCTRRIRRLESQGQLTGHMKIIAITANARQEQIDTALEAGVDHVMSKPFRVKDLLRRMEEVSMKN